MKWLVLFLLLFCSTADGAVICREGRALLPVVVSPQSSDAVKGHARQLADYLGRIGNAQFDVKEQAATAGISLEVDFDQSQPEHYTIRSDAKSVHIVGASDLAVQHAVWDLLYRLGYRQYFPTVKWEIVPRLKLIEIDLNVDERPDYRSRNVWYSYSRDAWNYDAYLKWVARNRMGGAFELNTGHAWNGIVHRHKQEFAEHPEWLALIDGKRITPNGIEKFCVSNAELRLLVVRDVLAQAKSKPTLDSISLDPSDGLGWCECEACRAIGKPSDRVVLLANDAATALERAGYNRMHIGTYAYAGHAAPPRTKPHPKIIISVATAFSDLKPDELLAGWKKVGVNEIGIREYHSVVAWDRNLPGASRGGNTNYLARTISTFHGFGARFYTSESGDSWGPHGVGHFLSSRLLWDVDEAKRVDKIVDRFVRDCFGDAAEPMARFYELIDGANKSLLSKDLIGRMYRLIDEAQKSTSDVAVHARLNDLALYTRYVEMVYAYRQGSVPDGVASMQLAWRIRKTGMVHTQAIYRDLPNRDKRIAVPENADWYTPEENNPWKSSEPFLQEDIATMVADGIERNPLFDFTPKRFGGVLRPAGLKRAQASLGDFGPRDRYEQTWQVWMQQPGELTFDALAGIIPSYRKVRDTRFELHTDGQPIDGVVDSANVRPDGETHVIRLQTKVGGLHRLTSADAGAMTTMTFSDDLIVTREASTQSPLHLNSGVRLYFYVPRGTRTIGGFSKSDKPRIFPSDQNWEDGKTIGPGYFAIKVPDGQDGMCWRLDIRSSGSDVILMTVPPYVARAPDQLLLPSEVVIEE